MKEQIQFNTIYVIQSLPKREVQTGTNLFNDILLRRAGLMQDFHVDLVDIVNYHQLDEVLKLITDSCSPDGMRPYLHFEVHGNKAGLSLSNGDLVTWEVLYTYFVKINRILKNQLFVSLATCFGAYIFQVINPLAQSPLFAYIGPAKEILVVDLEADFSEYFDALLQTKDINIAIDALNQHNANANKYVVNFSEMIFDQVADNFINQFKGRDTRRAKIQSMLKVAWKDHQVRKTHTKETLRHYFDHHLLQRPEHIRKMKDYFLFRRSTPNFLLP